MTGGEEVAADVCLAFPLPDSRGTQDCIRKAQAAGIPRIVSRRPDPIRAWMLTICGWRMSDYLRKEFGIHAYPGDWDSHPMILWCRSESTSMSTS